MPNAAAAASIDRGFLKDFRAESLGLLIDLQLVMGELEGGGTLDAAALRDYGQKVDRVMGAAKMFAMMDKSHVGLAELSRLTELGKQIAYAAAEVAKPAETAGLVPTLSRLAGTLVSLAEAVEDGDETQRLSTTIVPPLLRDLEALKTRLPNIARPKGL